MANFPNVNAYYKGRTNTGLVVSPGDAPAQKFIVDATENANVKFNYSFAPLEHNQAVVIPKGKAVTLAGLQYDVETEKYVPALKICGVNDNPIGINHHNVYQTVRDTFSGTAPTVITREFIELPLFPSKSAANSIKWGAIWADGDSAKESADSLLGKQVAVDEFGNLTLATSVYKNVIGTCLGAEIDLPPAGYLEYFTEMTDSDLYNMLRNTQAIPSSGRKIGSQWNDIGSYAQGSAYLTTKDQAMFKNFRNGISFLTDGYFRARESVIYGFADVAAVAATETTAAVLPETKFESFVAQNVTVDETAKTVKTDGGPGCVLYVRLPDKLAADGVMKASTTTNPEFSALAPQGVKVMLGTDRVSDANVHVDMVNNQIVIYFPEAVETAKQLTITAMVLKNRIPGIPTNWDFRQSLGVARILLQK